VSAIVYLNEDAIRGRPIRLSSVALERSHTSTVSDATYWSSKLMLFSMMTLMADAVRVIEMRMQMMALGKSTPTEMQLMVSEKMNAMEEAKAIIARGGNPSLVIENYQRIVSANIARLSEQQSD
jgi:NAD(P)-dependent dehydrogenase (short-subunit alcohol dehydrogenase family)